MPRRDDLNHILVIGSGPIVIGQACEFDYSGTQACRVLKQEGIRVSLVNSNPATIMTDPEFADSTYVQPITAEYIEKIFQKEAADGHPIDAVLPTLGGQTALNAAVDLHDRGLLEKYNVELIGASFESIQRGEDRQTFKDIVEQIGGESARSRVCYTMDEVHETVEELGLPVVVRPSFTMGGLGSGMAYTMEDLDRIAGGGLAASPTANVLIEESILGWKEFELELMRDHNDNVVVVCSIENLDPVGVHTGDSITVAPAMTLTDREYQIMRDQSIAILRAVGVDTGGCNIQFAQDPKTGRLVVIEMNPRVSRSSALASKATGFPIAKIAAKLAIGYTLDEIPNDITKETPASFEPTLDYVVVKAPRFAFEKFPGVDDTLTTTMKSVGEAMALGRNFRGALNKVLRSLETKFAGFWTRPDDALTNNGEKTVADLLEEIKRPTENRIYTVEYLLRQGVSIDDLYAATAIDPWFLGEIKALVDVRNEIVNAPVLTGEMIQLAKYNGFSDRQIASLRTEIDGEAGVRNLRNRLGIHPVYKAVDTCAAEFEAKTPYHYSAYEYDSAAESEVAPQKDRPKVIILGSGPNRIGQGIEFDYSCVHAAQALSAVGYETIMVNCNPETVSTDYDTSDRLYFEPLTNEDVLEIIDTERSNGTLHGVIVQFGGQTPLKLAESLEKAKVPILGTSPDAIDLAEDRDRFKALLDDLGLRQPANGIARSAEEARKIAEDIGFPVVIRPSYVLGGRAMEIVHGVSDLERYMKEAVVVSGKSPVLIDSYLRDATEVDVDALCDGEDVFVAGILEHIEEAGVHSGDSACSMPPFSLSDDIIAELEKQTAAMALALGVVGLMNVQFAIKDGDIYVIEVNPRASRTVPFVAKVLGAPVAGIASRMMAGEKLKDFNLSKRKYDHIAVKEAVFPFARFPGVDTILGPEMRSTGEVMGLDRSFGVAFAKSQIGGGTTVPKEGTAFISVKDSDKDRIVAPARQLIEMGFKIVATSGTARFLEEQGVAVERINKVLEGRPHIVDAITNGQVQLVFNTTEGAQALADSASLRRAALQNKVPYYTTLSGAIAATKAIAAMRGDELHVASLQSYMTAAE